MTPPESAVCPEVTGKSGGSKLQSIQYLRGLAALMVAFSHAQLMIPSFPSLVPYFFGNAGVYVFFAISGFLMVHVTEHKPVTPGNFAYSRVVRVVPMYWLCTIGVATLLYFVPELGRGTELSWRHFLLSLAFVPHMTEAEPGSILPMLKVGWTLIYEMFFYSLFVVSMMLSYRRRAYITGAVLAVLVALFYLLNASRADHFLLSVYGDPVVLQFLFGMMLALGARHIDVLAGGLSKTSVSRFIAPAMLVGLCAWMAIGDAFDVTFDPYARVVAYGLPCALILLVALISERSGPFVSRSLLLLGEASYSIYLIHMLPIAFFRFGWRALDLPTVGYGWAAAFILLATGASTVAGILLYLLVERPMLARMKDARWMQRFVPKRPQVSN